MPAPWLIELSEQEREEFHRLCPSGKTESRLQERLSIELLADEGSTNGEIAQQIPVSAHKALRERERERERENPAGFTHEERPCWYDVP